jgi:hypothetical protein
VELIKARVDFHALVPETNLRNKLVEHPETGGNAVLADIERDLMKRACELCEQLCPGRSLAATADPSLVSTEYAKC